MKELHSIVAQLEPSVEQEPAIMARGCAVVVTAGAGTGKTRALVARYLALLAEGVDLRAHSRHHLLAKRQPARCATACETTGYTYNSEGDMATMYVTATGVSTLWTWTFGYSDGKLASISDPVGRVTTFTVE